MRKVSSVALVLASIAVPACALAVQGHYLPEGVNEGAQRAGGYAHAVWSKLTAGMRALEDGQGLAATNAVQDDGADELKAAAGGSNPWRASGRRRAFVERSQRVFPIEATSRRPIGQMNARVRRDYGRFALTRMLQRELRRVGCYSGQVNGVWTPSTRRAMMRFTARANAMLPVDSPDDALLAIVRSHANKACGPCPDGETPSQEGRCIPAILVERGAKRSPEPSLAIQPPVTGSRRPATAKPVAALAVPPGRMRLAGPKIVNEAPQSPGGARATARGRSDRTRRPRRTREAGARKLGAWIFHDAPVDRLLAR